MGRLKLLCPLLLLAGCGPTKMVAVVDPPRPTPHVVDTATPPQLRPTYNLTFLSTTDVHTRLVPYDYYTRREIGYGLARLKPIVDSIRAAHREHVYLFDSGDLLQGNPVGYVHARVFSNLPNPVIQAMNLMGYDAAAVGNHEFNFGLPHLRKAMDEAKFPFVTANICDVTPSGCDPWPGSVLIPHLVSPDDTILIGVTGNTPPGVQLWDRANVEGKLKFAEIVGALRAQVAYLKELGADIVVVLSHGGLSGTSYDTSGGIPQENVSAEVARVVPGIDVILLGHTHVEITDTTINGVLLTQAKNWAQSMSVVDLKLERRKASDWLAIEKHAHIVRPDSTRADTAFLRQMNAVHQRTVDYVNSVAGTSTARMEATKSRLQDTPIIDFINQVQRKVAGTQLSAAAAFDTTASLPKGQITVADVAGLYIYENTLRAVRITGAQLRAYLEKSSEFHDGGVPGYNFDAVVGVDYTLDVRKPRGQRVVKLTYQGKPVRDTQTFTMALNNYRQGGGGGYTMLAGAPVIYDRQEDIKELLINEIKAQKTIRPERYYHKNWELIR